MTNSHCLFIFHSRDANLHLNNESDDANKIFRREICNIVRVGAVLHGELGAAERKKDRRCHRAEATTKLCGGADLRKVSLELGSGNFADVLCKR